MFDIVIVCFNDDIRLEKTLDSVVRAGFGGRIVLQDGSCLVTTVDLVARFSMLDICHVQQLDSGLYDAMNKAVHSVKSEFFLTLNCGDLLCSDFLKTSSLLSLSRFDLVCCSAVLVYHDGLICKFPPKFYDLNNYMACCHQSILIKRDFFSLLGGYNLDFKIAADYEFLCRAVRRQDTCILFVDNEIVFFEGDSGLSEKYRFLLEYETFLVRKKYAKSLVVPFLFVIHMVRFVKFKISIKMRLK